MFIIIGQSIKIWTNETDVIQVTIFSVLLYNIILFKYTMKLIINSITEFILIYVWVYFLIFIITIILNLPYQIGIQNLSIEIRVPYNNIDKIHWIYNIFPWNLDNSHLKWNTYSRHCSLALSNLALWHSRRLSKKRKKRNSLTWHICQNILPSTSQTIFKKSTAIYTLWYKIFHSCPSMVLVMDLWNFKG